MYSVWYKLAIFFIELNALTVNKIMLKIIVYCAMYNSFTYKLISMCA